MLDDALIHLRYAEVLHDRHFLSFDGIHPSYGVSSLLYVGILAVLRSITQSPLLPKVLSLVGYAASLAFAYWIFHVNRIALALSFALVSPFAVRWLTDGMETSLAALLSMVFAAFLYKRASPATIGSLAFVLPLVRVDLTLLVVFGGLLLLERRDWLRAAALCVGSGLSLIFIELAMGHLLPDTAVAKVGDSAGRVFTEAAREILATASFGIGLIAIWTVSARLAWNINKKSTIIANLPLPTLVLLAAIRGQQFRAVRYMIWALLFSIVWNLLQSAAAPQIRPIFLYTFAAVMVLAWIIEVPVVLRIDRGHNQNLKAMERAQLDRLHGEGMAGDVGFIGYFSRAHLCDLNGLVNGRAAAQMTQQQRADACLAERPAFLFLSAMQIAFFNQVYNLQTETEFFNCGSVDFTNVSGSDRHWLLVRRTDYPEGCPAHL
ncbi:MAG: hypothetical protein M3O31_13715 [Acidobacteriota bacterium]|nr:hypothetical protein [Acidobacteriota bacterium]